MYIKYIIYIYINYMCIYKIIGVTPFTFAKFYWLGGSHRAPASAGDGILQGINTRAEIMGTILEFLQPGHL